VVQTNWTVETLSCPEDVRRGWGRRAIRTGRIAQGREPIGRRVGPAAPLQGTLALMEAARANLVVVPHGEQGQQARREGAMDGQVGTEHAVPVLDSAARTDGRLPGGEEPGGNGTPRFWQQGQQVVGTGTEEGAAWPGPGQRGQRVAPQTGARRFRWVVLS